MSSAASYAQESAFERLYSKSEMQTPVNSTAPESLSFSIEGSVSQAEREENFNAFYHRQQSFLELKAAKLKKRQEEPEHKPRLCDKSMRMTQKPLKIVKTQAPSSTVGTFVPKISALGKASRQRSVEEMSYGDAERRLRRVEELRKLYEDEEARNYQKTLVQYPSATDRHCAYPSSDKTSTFTESGSKLRLLDDPDSYTDRIKEAIRLKAAKAERERCERATRELDECTYAPRIIDAPAFVKRVARSMAILKAQRALDEDEDVKQLYWR
jgi:hypothetical protein